MDETLMNMCDLLMANFETLCRNYKLEETMNIAGAMILTNEHETADIERMKACYNIIKRSEGIFSVYRNYMRIPVMTKMSRCPYGITKPICDRCDNPCFGAGQTQEFLKIMDTSQKRMLLSHPIMTVKHKLASMGVDYAKQQQAKKLDEKVKAREKAAKERAKNRKKKK